MGSGSRFKGGRAPALGIVFSHQGPAFLTLKDWLNIIERFPFVVRASRLPKFSSAQSTLKEAAVWDNHKVQVVGGAYIWLTTAYSLALIEMSESLTTDHL